MLDQPKVWIMKRLLGAPLPAGRRYGGIIHLVSRLFPKRLSNLPSTSFQGIQKDRTYPKEIKVVDIRGHSEIKEIQVRVIQGILNRNAPIVYLVGSEKDEFWLSNIQSDIREFPIDELPWSSYPSITYDSSSIKQTYLAITLAGIHDAIPTPLTNNFGIDFSCKDVLFDLTTMNDREMNSKFHEAANKACKSMISFRNTPAPETIDLIVNQRMILSPLALHGTWFRSLGGRTSKEEAEVLRQIIESMDPDSAMLGYNPNPGIAGEYETINYLSKHGMFSLPVPGVPNLSFFSGFPKVQSSQGTRNHPNTDTTLGAGSRGGGVGGGVEEIAGWKKEANVPRNGGKISNGSGKTQNVQTEFGAKVTGTTPIKPEEKVHVVILMSDGDNLDLPYSKYDFFSQEHTTPLGWSVSPFLNEFAPVMFEYYTSHLQQGDTLVAAPSGGGFCYPSYHRHLPAFLEHTERFMRESGLEYLWLLDHPIRGYSKPLLRKFADFTKGMFLEYVIIRPYSRSIEFHDGIPTVFSSAFVEKDGKVAEAIQRSTPKKDGPSFLFVGVEMRYNTPEHIDSEIAKLDHRKYTVVGVPEFMDLIKRYKMNDAEL